MRIAVISFTKQGARISGRIKTALEEQEHTEVFCCTKCNAFRKEAEQMNSLKGQMIFVEEPLADWTRAQFGTSDALIFVGACGIAVRAIAPAVRDKLTDIPVLVLDELGQYVIPILSGHYGGGNELAVLLAEKLGAQAVLTTATDVNGKFAVDEFAARTGCAISDMQLAKAFAAGILERGLPLASAFPIVPPLPGGVYEAGSGALGVYIGCDVREPFQKTLRLIPKKLRVGLGCRRGVCASAITSAIRHVFAENRLDLRAISGVFSIDLKKDEPGLNALAEEWKLPFVTYTEEELKNVEGEFTPSAFVKTITGVENVCERSAVLGSDNGRLIRKKTGREGVTTALALRKWEVRFE